MEQVDSLPIIPQVKQGNDICMLLQELIDATKRNNEDPNNALSRKHTTKDVHDKSNKPTEPIKVYTRVNIFEVKDIDTANQTTTLDMYYEVCWNDVDRPKAINSEYVPTWHPEMFFVNHVESEIKKEWFGTDSKYDEKFDCKMTCYRCKLVVTIGFDMWLKEFPFDRQEVDIILRTDWTDEFMIVDQNPHFPSNINFEMLKKNNLFYFPDFTSRIIPQKLVDAGVDATKRGKFPLITYRLPAKRKPAFVLYNVLLPMFFLTTMTLGSFAVDAVEYADRCGITLTLLLTIIAYKFVIQDDQYLPKLPYLTFADKYMFLCAGFQASIMFQHYIVVMAFEGESTMQQSADRMCNVISALFWALIHAIIIFRRTISNLFKGACSRNKVVMDKTA